MTAQTEPQAVPETGEDDADRRAERAADILMELREIDIGATGLRLIANEIHAAVEAEQERCLTHVTCTHIRDWSDRDCDALIEKLPPRGLISYVRTRQAHQLVTDITAAIRARGEAS